MTHEPRTPISKAVEQPQDEVKEAEVEVHRWSYSAPETDDNSAMVNGSPFRPSKP